VERVPGATDTTPHKHLATALGLDQLMYAFLIFISFRPTYLDGFGPSGDFAVEIGSELAYFASRLTGRPPSAPIRPNFGQAFGVEGYALARNESRGSTYLLLNTRMSNDDGSRLVSNAGSSKVV
jgi:hypothetical protein